MGDEARTSEQVVEAIYTFAADLLQKGTPPAEIEKQLMEQGLEAETAHIVVQNLVEVRAKAIKEAGHKNMLYGALWCIGGIIITAITYQAAEGGGKYVVAWGAILFGAIQFFRGLSQSSQGS